MTLAWWAGRFNRFGAQGTKTGAGIVVLPRTSTSKLSTLSRNAVAVEQLPLFRSCSVPSSFPLPPKNQTKRKIIVPIPRVAISKLLSVLKSVQNYHCVHMRQGEQFLSLRIQTLEIQKEYMIIRHRLCELYDSLYLKCGGFEILAEINNAGSF